MAARRIGNRHVFGMIVAVMMIGPMVFASGLLPVGGNSDPVGALSSFSAVNRTHAEGGSLASGWFSSRKDGVSTWMYLTVRRRAEGNTTVGERSAPVGARTGLDFWGYLERCGRRRCTYREFDGQDVVTSQAFTMAPDLSTATFRGRVYGKRFEIRWTARGPVQPHGYGFQWVDRGLDHAGVQQYEEDGIFRDADVTIRGRLFRAFRHETGDGVVGHEAWDYSNTWTTNDVLG